MRNRYLYVTLLSLLGFSTEAAAQTLRQAPRLVVSIGVDQLRTDLLEAFAPHYQAGGLRRMLSEGKVFAHSGYGFTPVDRASATASVLTGTTPYYNGVTGAEWMDRNTLRPKSIVDGLQPQLLSVTTIGDELKMATQGLAKVFAFAADAERAILSAGHAADGAAWIANYQWNVVPYYKPENQWIRWYARQYKPTGDEGQSLTMLALKCVEQSGIGQDDIADLICLSYSLQPTEESYVALDHQMAELVDGIERKMGHGSVLFVLTGTGCQEQEHADDYERYHIPTGKFYINRTANLLNMYLGAVYGAGQYVETAYGNQLFLDRKLADQKNIDRSDLLRRAQQFVLQLAGVRNVYTASQLMASDSPLLQKTRNGFHIDRCGDLLIDIAPGWQLINEDTNSSSISRTANIPFPIIFYGCNIQPARIDTPVTADRIAPTVARAIRIRAPNACTAEPLF